MKHCLLRAILVCTTLLAASQAAESRPLPAPHKTGGKPLMEALSLRATSRAFDTRALDDQQLSDLLWAAFGVNRPNGKRTAPSAKNWQEVDLYVLTADGAFLYEPVRHQLSRILSEDIRALGGIQPFVKDAPVTLVYIADLARTDDMSTEEQKREFAALDVGFISENAYLYCASEGLVTGARAYVDKAPLAAKLGLRARQWIVLAQSVGHPAAQP